MEEDEHQGEIQLDLGRQGKRLADTLYVIAHSPASILSVSLSLASRPKSDALGERISFSNPTRQRVGILL